MTEKKDTGAIQAQHYVESEFISQAHSHNADNVYLNIVPENLIVPLF